LKTNCQIVKIKKIVRGTYGDISVLVLLAIGVELGDTG